MGKSSPQRTNLVWLIFFLALILRIAVVLLIGKAYEGQYYEYGIIAQNLAAGKGYSGLSWLGPPDKKYTEVDIGSKHRNGNTGAWFLGPSDATTAGFTPIFPVTLAGCLVLFGQSGWLAMQLLQALLTAALCVMVYNISRRFFDEKISLISALLTALYPNLIYASVRLAPTVFHTFMLAVTLLALLKIQESPTVGRGIGLGLAIGVTILVEPIIMSVLPLIFLWLWLNSAQARSATIKSVMVAGLVSVLTIVPWTVRNYLAFHKIIPMRSTFGLTLWMGNNPEATGIGWTKEGEVIVEILSPSTLAQLASQDEVTRSEALKDMAIKWIKENPGQFARLCLRRLVYFWWYTPIYDNPGTEYNTKQRSTLIRKLAYSIPGIMLLLVLPVAWQRWRERSLFIFLFIGFTLPYIFMLSGALRYRLPIEPYLIIFFSYYVSKLLSRWSSKFADA